MFPRRVSGQVLNISADIQTYSTTSQGNLFQCLTILALFFSCVKMAFHVLNLCHCLLSCQWALLRRVWLAFVSSHQLTVHIDNIPPELSFLQTEQSQLSFSSYERCFSVMIISVTLQWKKSLQRGCKVWNRCSPFCSLGKMSGREVVDVNWFLLHDLYIAIAKWCLLLSVKRKQRQGFLRPDCSLFIFILFFLICS